MSGSSLEEFFAEQTADGAAEAALAGLLEAVAEQGGTTTVASLVEGGHEEASLLVALTPPTDDKRRRPLLRGEAVAGVRVVRLTSAGWAAVGHPNKREQRPSPERLDGILAPGRICQWARGLPGRLPEDWPPNLVDVRAACDAPALSEFTSQVVARAWQRVTDQTNRHNQVAEVGEMTRPESVPRPDGLLWEEYRDPGHAVRLWPHVPALKSALEAKTPAVVRLGIEVETARKNTADLSAKLARLNAVLSMGTLDAVVWVVDDQAVAERLSRFGVGTQAVDGSASHYFAEARKVGLREHQPVVAPGLAWWAAGM